MKTISNVIAEFIQSASVRNMSDQTLWAAKKLLLDTIGTSLAGSNAPGISQVYEQIADWGGAEESTLLLYGNKVPLPNAVLVNSIMAHALDFDDQHVRAALHISSLLVPVAVGVGEFCSSTGIEVLSALVIGFEVAVRLALEYRKRSLHFGFLPTSIIGSFGAAAAASKLMQLSVDETINALGINYSQTAGNRQALLDTSLAKRIQPAFGAQKAVVSTLLAKRGFTGPRRIFEGQAGLFAIYGCDGTLPEPSIFSGLPNIWEIEQTSIKLFPSCGGNHPVSKLSLDIVEEMDLKPEDVDCIHAYLANESFFMVGFPFRMGEYPQINAQFCAAYAIALAFTRRRIGVNEYNNSTIRSDKITLDFLKKISVQSNDMMDHPPVPEKRIDTIVITLKTGKKIIREMSIMDIINPQNTTFLDVEKKFKDCLEYTERFNDDQIQSIISSIGKFEHINNVADFIANYLVVS
jgi:2-methylcitrate dehydratase PrpD